MVKDIPSIPMFARPVYVIRSAKRQGSGRQPDARGQPVERQHLGASSKAFNARRHVPAALSGDRQGTSPAPAHRRGRDFLLRRE